MKVKRLAISVGVRYFRRVKRDCIVVWYWGVREDGRAGSISFRAEEGARAQKEKRTSNRRSRRRTNSRATGDRHPAHKQVL